MKARATTSLLVPLALLLPAALSAPLTSPNPADPGLIFPITDVVGTGLTVEEYAHQLAAGNVASAGQLSKRQYPADTYNQLTDGTPCRDITVIYARGTTQDGNVGGAAKGGPQFFDAIAKQLGGTSRLAIQGVDYAATIGGFLSGGDAAGTTTMFNLINTAISKCPSTKIVVSGYSQGGQLVHKASRMLSADAAARVTAIVVFGDPDRGESFGLVDTSKILVFCHDGDRICDGTIFVTADHLNYEKDAPTLAAFVVSKVG